MIGFWIAAGILTAGIVALLTLPLMRRHVPASQDGQADLAVYRDQLAELERDRSRGLIEADQAASLEAEIGRRVLSAARSSKGPEAARSVPARRLALALMGAVPVAALTLYLVVGHPDLPAQPLADRTIAPNTDPAKILAMVEHMKAGLKPVKEDLDKWVMVAEAYGRLGRPRDAADAFRVAAALAPEDPSLGAALAEALIEADGGAVGDEAKKLFAAVPADSPARPEAQYYLALGQYQAGDIKGALGGWQALLAGSPADAPYLTEVRTRIAEAAKSLGLDPAKETPAPRPAAASPPVAGGAGPSQSDVQAAASMTPEQREQMIRSMVASLAAKLEANPGDAEGWRRLARAYQVLGEPDKAKDALDRAAAAERKAPAPSEP